jgi:predicted nucleic acid-binding protein
VLTCYLDASAWVKRYARETGWAIVDQALDAPAATASVTLLISGIAYAETLAALNSFRHRVAMADEDFRVLLQGVWQDLRRVRWISIADQWYRDATELCIVHNLNASDAVQLAALLHSGRFCPLMAGRLAASCRPTNGYYAPLKGKD